MQFTKIVHLIGGEKILITEKECEALKKLLKQKPQGFVEIQNELVNKTSIAYIGNHSATSDMAKMDKATTETNLKLEGKEKILEQIKSEEKRIAIKSASNEKVIIGDSYLKVLGKIVPIESKPMTSEESARGDAEYYIDKKTGEKMYS